MINSIVLADDNPAVRSAMGLMLTQKLGLRIAGEAADLLALSALCVSLHPDLVLLDWELPGFDHLAISLDSLRLVCPGARVVVMSTRTESCLQAQAEGADAVIPKTEAPGAVTAILARLIGACAGESAQ